MKFNIILFSFLILCSCTQKEPFNLTEQNYELWKNYIKPTENDLLWTSIPWRSSFREGLKEADAQKKPMLLWVMNGHPLGCT